jgi:mono/diheme cytochrome c family protein
MKRFTVVLLCALWAPLAALSQNASLDASQLEGMRHFNQSCRVCHTKPQTTSPQYAPVLSRASLGGQEAALRVFIANGTAKMPGFKYHFKPEEIDAIVSYLRTVAPQAD